MVVKTYHVFNRLKDEEKAKIKKSVGEFVEVYLNNDPNTKHYYTLLQIRCSIIVSHVKDIVKKYLHEDDPAKEHPSGIVDYTAKQMILALKKTKKIEVRNIKPKEMHNVLSNIFT